MKYQKQHIEVPVEMRHFDWKKYDRKGISQILNLQDYVELIVEKVDIRNQTDEVDGWREEELHRELLRFSDYLLNILKETAYRDAEAFLKQEQRIKSLELSLGLRKKPQKMDKKVSDKEKKEVERIASLIKLL